MTLKWQRCCWRWRSPSLPGDGFTRRGWSWHVDQSSSSSRRCWQRQVCVDRVTACLLLVGSCGESTPREGWPVAGEAEGLRAWSGDDVTEVVCGGRFARSECLGDGMSAVVSSSCQGTVVCCSLARGKAPTGDATKLVSPRGVFGGHRGLPQRDRHADVDREPKRPRLRSIAAGRLQWGVGGRLEHR